MYFWKHKQPWDKSKWPEHGKNVFLNVAISYLFFQFPNYGGFAVRSSSNYDLDPLKKAIEITDWCLSYILLTCSLALMLKCISISGRILLNNFRMWTIPFHSLGVSWMSCLTASLFFASCIPMETLSLNVSCFLSINCITFDLNCNFRHIVKRARYYKSCRL